MTARSKLNCSHIVRHGRARRVSQRPFDGRRAAALIVHPHTDDGIQARWVDDVDRSAVGHHSRPALANRLIQPWTGAALRICRSPSPRLVRRQLCQFSDVDQWGER